MSGRGHDAGARRFLALATVLLLHGCGERDQPTGGPPRFEDYPVTRIWAGAPVVPDVSSHPDASHFGAALWQGARRGPNFAGHYTIVSRTCGRLCQEFVIVDAVTGRVHAGLSDTPPLDYRLDSRLIAFDGPEPEGLGLYYVWNDPRLELVTPVP